MCMRSGLPLRIDARAAVLYQGRGAFQATVRTHSEGCDTPTAVICHNQCLTGLVHNQVTRAPSTGRNRVQGSQRTAFSIDRKRGDGPVYPPVITELADGV